MSSTRNGLHVKQLVEVREKCLSHFKYWSFSYKKRIDPLQEAFIHPPEPCEARFVMDGHVLFDYF